MQKHRKLTIIGAVLLAATFLLNGYSQEGQFNYAYVTGISMIIAFMLSFFVFTKENWTKK